MKQSMQKFFKQIRTLEEQSGKQKLYPLFNTARKFAVKAVVRELQKRGLSQAEVEAAKHFLKIGRYDKKGIAKSTDGQVFLAALKLKRNNKLDILKHIQSATLFLSREAGKAKLKELARNPLVQMNTDALGGEQFLNKTQGLDQDIENSTVAEKDKKKLLRYVRGK
ncbi:MAG: hypothetical protein Q8R15_04120 [Candidatus Micrarchaeota archaeon]|nr:hypothetical protein [Candidatus Micrarchaeota archaeon]